MTRSQNVACGFGPSKGGVRRATKCHQGDMKRSRARSKRSRMAPRETAYFVRRPSTRSPRGFRRFRLLLDALELLRRRFLGRAAFGPAGAAEEEAAVALAGADGHVLAAIRAAFADIDLDRRLLQRG